MTILSAIQQICPVIGLTVPTAVFSSTDREHVELQALANEMAQRIAFDTHDWSRLKTLATITGDGVAQAFDLPVDYRRMLKKAHIWPSATPYAPYRHYPDSDQWLGLSLQSASTLVGAWTIIGNQILIKPTLPDQATVQFYYLSTQSIKGADGTIKGNITADDDSFILYERPLRLGMIWQWKAYKGRPYAEDMATYEDALAMVSGNDRGSNIIAVGRRRSTVDADFAFPGVIGP